MWFDYHAQSWWFIVLPHQSLLYDMFLSTQVYLDHWASSTSQMSLMSLFNMGPKPRDSSHLLRLPFGWFFSTKPIIHSGVFLILLYSLSKEHRLKASNKWLPSPSCCFDPFPNHSGTTCTCDDPGHQLVLLLLFEQPKTCFSGSSKRQNPLFIWPSGRNTTCIFNLRIRILLFNLEMRQSTWRLLRPPTSTWVQHELGIRVEALCSCFHPVQMEHQESWTWVQSLWTHIAIYI